MTRTLQSSIVREFSQADFDDFARLSGDNNPIHTNPDFSAGTRFGRTVAHGLLLFSVLRGLLDKQAPDCQLSEQSLMFPAPTYACEPMLFSVTSTSSVDDAKHIDFEMEVKRVKDGVVTCQGSGKAVL